jgi:acylphosphatase
MSRIVIDDLPVAECLTPEQEELIQGAGLRSFRPSLEVLEGREVPATISVTSLADYALGARHSGVTLRDAVHAANTNTSVNGSVAGSGADEIVFSPKLSGTITLKHGELLIKDAKGTTTITGLGADKLTIDGNNASRIFNAATEATIKELKLTHGAAVGGGAINASSDLTLINNFITHNKSEGGGGGVSVGGSLLAIGNTIANNTSVFNGGGVEAHGASKFVNCTIVNNTSAPDTAGGIYAGGSFTAINCTIAGNAGDLGSGVLASGAATVINTIIVGNLDGTNPDNPQLLTPQATPKITASLIGGDPTAVLQGSVVDGRFVPLLTNNGGPTPTVALKAGGPAIAAGASADAPATDQRGVTRANKPDIGAYQHTTTSRQAPAARSAPSGGKSSGAATVAANKVARVVHYSGRVQGVNFRATAAKIAKDYPVTGWVKNLPDGRVELLAEGSEQAVQQFLAAIRGHWAGGGNIENEQVETAKPTGEYQAFTVRS